jgi:hypothetical protein
VSRGRHSPYFYPRELKLSAVQWFLNTYVKGKKPGERLVRISRYQAAKTLGITTTMLRTWTRNRARIADQRKRSRRARIAPPKGKEPDMEHALYRKFEERRRTGKVIGAQWFLRRGRALYRQQYCRMGGHVLSHGVSHVGYHRSNSNHSSNLIRLPTSAYGRLIAVTQHQLVPIGNYRHLL